MAAAKKCAFLCACAMPNSFRWNGGLKGRKGSLDEGGLRSPFFIRWPERLRAGAGDLLDHRGQHVTDPAGAHARDERQPARGAFGVEPVLTQSAYFRPHNQSEEIDRLYLVGAGTHPGACATASHA